MAALSFDAFCFVGGDVLMDHLCIVISSKDDGSI